MFLLNIGNYKEENKYKTIDNINDVFYYIYEVKDINLNNVDSTTLLSKYDTYYILTNESSENPINSVNKIIYDKKIYYTIIDYTNVDNLRLLKIFIKDVDNNIYADELKNLIAINVNEIFKNKIDSGIYISEIYTPEMINKSAEYLRKQNIIEFLNNITYYTSDTDFTISFKNVSFATIEIMNKLTNLYLNIYVFDYYYIQDILTSYDNTEISYLDESNLIIEALDFNFKFLKPHYVKKITIKDFLNDIVINTININRKEVEAYSSQKLAILYRISLANNSNYENIDKNLTSPLYIKLL